MNCLSGDTNISCCHAFSLVVQAQIVCPLSPKGSEISKLLEEIKNSTGKFQQVLPHLKLRGLQSRKMGFLNLNEKILLCPYI